MVWLPTLCVVALVPHAKFLTLKADSITTLQPCRSASPTPGQRSNGIDEHPGSVA
jgi:hypothetical protein